MIDPLLDLPMRTVHLLVGIGYLLSVLQCIHTYLSIVRGVGRIPEHEGALVLHMLALTLVATAISYQWPNAHVDFYLFHVSVDDLLWVGVGVVLFDVAVAALRRAPYVLMDAIVVTLTLPVTLAAADTHASTLFGATFVYYLVRTIVMIALDHRDGMRNVSSLSVAEAIRALPTGILYVDEEGSAVFDNDAMRTCLLELGIPLDLADLTDLLDQLPARERGDDTALVTLPSGESRLFVRGETSRRGLQRTRYLAYDVTDMLALQHELELTNEELEQANEQLIQTMADVQTFAENEALLNMQIRVHDVVGQRLSIMHRALEDNNLSDEAVAQLMPVITSALQDLTDTGGHPDDNLAAIARAFALAGVDVRIEGTFPDDQTTAHVFADIVREATTNAVRHAHATRVWASCTNQGDRTVLTIANDGTAPSGAIEEGTGIPGMRRAAEALGGTFDIETDTRFTIRVTIPTERDHDARADR